MKAALSIVKSSVHDFTSGLPLIYAKGSERSTKASVIQPPSLVYTKKDSSCNV